MLWIEKGYLRTPIEVEYSITKVGISICHTSNERNYFSLSSDVC